jgi:hypothetical protein
MSRQLGPNDDGRLTRRSLLAGTGAVASAGCAGTSVPEGTTTGEATAAATEGTATRDLLADVEAVTIAEDGAHLESIVGSLSSKETVWLQPDTVYEIDDTLEPPADARHWSILSMAVGALAGSVVKPTGDFPAFRISGEPRSADGPGWMYGWGVAGIRVDATNLTTDSDAWVVDMSRHFVIANCDNAWGSPRDGFHFGGREDRGDRPEADLGRNRFSACELNEVVARGDRYPLYVGGTSSFRANGVTARGGGQTGIHMVDASECWFEGVQVGGVENFFDVQAVSVNAKNVTLNNVHTEGGPTEFTLCLEAAEGVKVTNTTVENGKFFGRDATGAILRGAVENTYFDKCMWAQGPGDGTSIDAADRDVRNVHVSPMQQTNEAFPVDDPHDRIHYGATADAPGWELLGLEE